MDARLNRRARAIVR